MTALEWFFVILGALAGLLSFFGRGININVRIMGFIFGSLALFMGLVHFLPAGR